MAPSHGRRTSSHGFLCLLLSQCAQLHPQARAAPARSERRGRLALDADDASEEHLGHGLLEEVASPFPVQLAWTTRAVL